MDGEKYFLKLKNSIMNSPNIYLLLGILYGISIIYEIIVRLDLINFIILYILPITLLIIIDKLIFNFSNIYFPVKRAVFFEFVVFIIIFGIYLLFSIFFLNNIMISLLFAYSSLPFFRFMFLKPFIDKKDIYVEIISIYQAFIISLIIFLLKINYLYIIPFIFSSFLFVLISKLFIDYISREFKKTYNLDPVKYVGYYVNYLATRSINDMILLNSFMIKMYLYSNLKIDWIVVEKNDKKYSILFPQVHPGPFVEVGCSNLPHRLKSYLDFEDLIVFHTTVTNDQNCGGEDDIKKIANIIKNNKSRFKNTYTTDFFRYSNDIDILVHGINDTLIVTLLPTKYGFDDVKIDLGNFISKYLKGEKFKKVFVVDSHNYFDESYDALSKIDKNILDKIKNDSKKYDLKETKIGISKIYLKNKSIGPEGISCISFRSKKHFCYIVIDGNNMVKGLRDEIIRAGKEYFDDLEVFTTDNHYTNYNPKDLNPVGSENREEIVRACIEAMKKAIENESEAKISINSKTTNIKIPGENYMNKISEIVKNMVNKLKYSIIIVILTFIIVFIIFKVTFYFLG